MSFLNKQPSGPAPPAAAAAPQSAALSRRGGGGPGGRGGGGVLVEGDFLIPPDSPTSSASSMRNFGPSPVKKSGNKPAKVKVEDDDYNESNRRKPKKDSFVETEILPGDTLHSLALKYNVPAAELKRLNNIIGEREFYALKRIKIPVKPMSFLNEQLQPSLMRGEDAEENTNGWLVEHFTTKSPAAIESSSTGSPMLSDESEDGGGDKLVVFEGSGKVQQSRHIKKAKKIFRAVDKDLALIKQRNDGIVSTVIGRHGNEDQEEEQDNNGEWDDSDDEDVPIRGGGRGRGSESQTLLLLPSPPPGSRFPRASSSAKVSTTSKAVCLGCLALIVISVVVILWFADYEFEAIEHENRTDALIKNLEEHNNNNNPK